MHRTIISLLFLLLTPVSFAQDFDHSAWDQLLRQHVRAINDGHATAVHYTGMASDRIKLNAYLEQLAQVTQTQFDAKPNNVQLAFLINAYNAWTVELILTRYPDLESIKDLGGLFSSPWKKSFISLLGKTVSLDEIEHGLIRGSARYNEPRIHFAVNCASVGCPALRPEAYTADKLDTQLEEQTRQFLADQSRNRIKGKTFYVSSIFKWYEDDFETGWRGAKSLSAFLALYADALQIPAPLKAAAASGDADIEFLDYDWRLNDAK